MKSHGSHGLQLLGGNSLRTYLTVLFSTIIAVGAFAHDTETQTGLIIEHPWARPSVPGAQVSAGYIEIENTGQQDDVLLGATAEAVDEIQIHRMLKDGEMVMMERLMDGLPVPAGDYVTLQPGGLHFMLLGLQKQLIDGDTLSGTLVFKHAGRIDVTFMIEPLTKADERAEAHMGHSTMSMATDSD